MTASLAPCPRCRRHVRVGDTACPFCDAALSADHSASARPGTTVRLSRAAIFALGTSLAGCGTTSSVALYGAPAPPDAAQDAQDAAQDVTQDVTRDVTQDVGSDAGVDVPFDSGGMAAAYGIAPPPVDASADVPVDQGNFAPPYGRPPPLPDGG